MLNRIGQIQLKTLLWIFLTLPFASAWIGNVAGAFQSFQATLDIPKANPNRRQLLNVLLDINDLPLSEKRETLLFIPQSNLLYWNWHSFCKTTPFIAPALTGIAMLDGMPPAECDATYYGYPSYAKRSPNEPTLQASDREGICRAAIERGFTKVIVVDSNQNQETTVQPLTCNP